MPIVLTIEAEDADELMMKLRGFFRAANGDANVVPLAVATQAAEKAAVEHGAAPSALNPKPTMTVDDLRAGMTLKETQSTGIGGGVRAAPGDNVMFGGEEWHVYHTFRGKIIAMNEANVADILPAEECMPVAGEEPAKPRPGTAAALVDKPDPNQKPAGEAKAIGSAPVAQDARISPEEASRIRDEATHHVSAGTLDVEAVFQKLNDLAGVGNIDELTAAQARQFEAWVKEQVNGGAAPKMGF